MDLTESVRKQVAARLHFICTVQESVAKNQGSGINPDQKARRYDYDKENQPIDYGAAKDNRKPVSGNQVTDFLTNIGYLKNDAQPTSQPSF